MGFQDHNPGDIQAGLEEAGLWWSETSMGHWWSQSQGSEEDCMLC